MGSVGNVVPVAGEIAVAKVVREDEQNVWTIRCEGSQAGEREEKNERFHAVLSSERRRNGSRMGQTDLRLG